MLLRELPAASVAHVPMDGFHLADVALRRLGRLQAKGAPDTFDAGGYVALLRRLRADAEDVIYAPAFERDLEQPLAGAIAVPRAARLVLTEGNYLLVDDDRWPQVRRELAEVWFCDPDPEVRMAQLIARHVAVRQGPGARRGLGPGGRRGQRRPGRGHPVAGRPDRAGGRAGRRVPRGSGVMRGAVRGQHVEAEVGLRVAPDRVRVVGVALGVVVLDEQPRALQPVVVRRPGLGRTGPDQVHGVQRGRVGVAVQRRHLVRHPVEVAAQQLAQQLALPASSSVAGSPFGVAVSASVRWSAAASPAARRSCR